MNVTYVYDDVTFMPLTHAQPQTPDPEIQTSHTVIPKPKPETRSLNPNPETLFQNPFDLWAFLPKISRNPLPLSPPPSLLPSLSPSLSFSLPSSLPPSLPLFLPLSLSPSLPLSLPPSVKCASVHKFSACVCVCVCVCVRAHTHTHTHTNTHTHIDRKTDMDLGDPLGAGKPLINSV